jgi:hypothetical protein
MRYIEVAAGCSLLQIEAIINFAIGQRRVQAFKSVFLDSGVT